jgi:hypothetical protein
LTLGWNRRERLFFMAQRLGLDVSPDISDIALENLMQNQSATELQREFLQRLLTPMNKSVPRDLTYGRAEAAMRVAKEENLNYYAREVLEMGSQRLWQVGDENFLITNFYGEENSYRVVLQKVFLERDPGAPSARLISAGEAPLIADPVEMLECVPVDLTEWPYS